MADPSEHRKIQDAADIEELIAALADKSPIKRERARKALVKLKQSAVEALIKTLSDRRAHVRWEAAKALGEICDLSAAAALVVVLEDPDGDVRWLGAQGLIALGRSGLEPLLAVLANRPKSSWLREGAHHVFHGLAKKRSLVFVKPLLTALDQAEPEWAIPIAVSRALKVLKTQP